MLVVIIVMILKSLSEFYHKVIFDIALVFVYLGLCNCISVFVIADQVSLEGGI